MLKSVVIYAFSLSTSFEVIDILFTVFLQRMSIEFDRLLTSWNNLSFEPHKNKYSKTVILTLASETELYVI
jgi:hypothetical protein